MLEAKEVSNKIVDFLRIRGPSLPIQIAKYMQMNSLFVSAFLSELVGDKRVIASFMRVGGSPLYLLEGQQQRLDSFQQYLHPKEVEAYSSLKKEGILKDLDQDPAIRVALRSLKDFAFPFRMDGDIYWRFLTIKEEEVLSLINKKTIINEVEEKLKEPEIKKEKIIERPIEKKEETKIKQTNIIIEKPKKRIQKEIRVEKEEKPDIKQIFQNPLIEQEEEPKPKIIKEKPKSEFVTKVIDMLHSKNIKIVEEKEYKAKEYSCITEINSDLGPISFLTLAKDKKSIAETDLKMLLIDAQKIPLPALFIYTGNISKKAFEYLKTYSSILKVKSMD